MRKNREEIRYEEIIMYDTGHAADDPDQKKNHINYSVEPIKSNFLSDLVHMIFYRTVVSGIEHKSESGVYVEKDSYETAKKIVQDIT